MAFVASNWSANGALAPPLRLALLASLDLLCKTIAIHQIHQCRVILSQLARLAGDLQQADLSPGLAEVHRADDGFAARCNYERISWGTSAADIAWTRNNRSNPEEPPLVLPRI
jgi:hypothetical protein